MYMYKYFKSRVASDRDHFKNGACEKDFKECPKCGSTEIENRGPYWYCFRCDHEW